MNTEVTIPLWLYIVFALITTYAVVTTILYPGVRWFFRRRLNKVIDELNTHLKIDIRPFQNTKKQVLIERLAYDREVLQQIETLHKEKKLPRQVAQTKVRIYAHEIVPSFNAYIYYRFGYWVAKRVLRFLYRVKIAAADREKLKKVDSEATIVFVMNHRSNIDYVLVSYLMAEEVILSYAVGEWARVFPLQSLIKAMGAFFVRRNSNNPLYRKVLERYVNMATQEGVCQAVFLEGGLSRDGNFREPRLGFLDYLLRGFDVEKSRDIVFVPVAINYDHVLEDQNMLYWSNPEDNPAGQNNAVKLIKFLAKNLFIGRKARWKKNGYASVNFGLPLSMGQYCSDHNIDFTDLDKDQRFDKIGVLADELQEAIKHVMPILPVPLIATVFLRFKEHPENLKSLDIYREVGHVIDEIIEKDAPMRHHHKPRQSTIKEALQMLVDRKILIEDDDHYVIADHGEELLQYYANSIGHWFE